MSEATVQKENNFVAYEYATFQIKSDEAQIYKDCYQSFGWIPMEEKVSLASTDTVQLKMKRDRKLKGRLELGNLQRQAESALASIAKLEKAKTSQAMMVALGVGVAGAALIAGSVFSILAGGIPLGVVLAVPGFIGWGGAYLLYKKITAKKTAQANPQIDEQLEVVYSACNQANALLSI